MAPSGHLRPSAGAVIMIFTTHDRIFSEEVTEPFIVNREDHQLPMAIRHPAMHDHRNYLDKMSLISEINGKFAHRGTLRVVSYPNSQKQIDSVKEKSFSSNDEVRAKAVGKLLKCRTQSCVWLPELEVYCSLCCDPVVALVVLLVFSKL